MIIGVVFGEENVLIADTYGGRNMWRLYPDDKAQHNTKGRMSGVVYTAICYTSHKVQLLCPCKFYREQRMERSHIGLKHLLRWSRAP